MAMTHEELLSRKRARYIKNAERERTLSRERMRRHRVANPEHSAAVLRAWRVKNAARIATQRRAAYKADPRKVLARAHEWYVKNTARAKATARRHWHSADPDHKRKLKRQWRAKNPQKTRAMSGARNARRAGLKRERIDYAVLAARQKSICPWCGKRMKASDFTLDHIVPVALGAAAGASHTYANLQLLHGRCNSEKGATFGAGVQPYLAI